MIRGRRLGIDPGSVRVGVAISDPDGILATPLETVKRDRKNAADVTRIAVLVQEWEIVEVVVGVPTGLSGRPGAAVAVADEFAARLAEMVAPVPIVRQDERLSTVTATRQLRDSGVPGRRQRGVVDQAAAAVILQQWLDRLASDPGR